MIYVQIQLHPCYIIYSPLFWDMVVCENEFETEKKNHTKDKIEQEIVITLINL